MPGCGEISCSRSSSPNKAARGCTVSMFLRRPWYPFWATTIIIVDIAIIWALIVHGRVLANR